MTGTPARRAAHLPRRPALDVCVWTICGLSSLNILMSFKKALKSLSGYILLTSSGMVNILTPFLPASSRQLSTALVSDVPILDSYERPLIRMASYLSLSRPLTVRKVFSAAPPLSKRVMTCMTLILVIVNLL